jgi:transposase-like protein
MRKKSPRYDLAVQRSAAEQVVIHCRPVAQVARQLRCSPQSIKNWIDKHHQAPPTPVSSLPSHKSLSPFLPIQVESPSTVPDDKIELVTKNGLILRFPLDTPSEALCGIIRQLENVLC